MLDVVVCGFVEAFLIGKSDNRLYGKSEPFYVVIE